MDLDHHRRRVGREARGHAQQPQHARPRRTRSDAAGLRRSHGDCRVEPGQTRERQGETLQSVQQEEIDAVLQPPLLRLLLLLPVVLFGVAPRYRTNFGQMLLKMSDFSAHSNCHNPEPNRRSAPNVITLV